MFSYGFYNSLNGDRKYDAVQLSSIFDGIIQDGVYSNIGEFFAVVPGEGEGLNILVKTGRAWFNHTWSLNDSYLPLALDRGDPLLNRIDAVVLEVDTRIEKRENSIKIVKGASSLTPTKPTITNADGVFQHVLAYVTIKSGATTITASDIEIMVGKNETPFVQCPLKTVSISDLFMQWDSEFTTWFDDIKEQLSGNVATNLQNQINTLEENSATKQEVDSAISYVNDKNKVPTYKIFRLSGSFTVPSNAINNEFTIVCQGGGGGGSIAGGGGGGYTVIRKTSLTPVTTIPVTVGAGGIPGYSDESGQKGGSTIFGDIVTANGGNGGDKFGNGGSGGSGGGGGGGGQYGWTFDQCYNDTSNNGRLGNGGNGSYYGGGGGAARADTGGDYPDPTNCPKALNGGNGGRYGGGGAGGYTMDMDTGEINKESSHADGTGGELGGNAWNNGPWHDTIELVMDKFFIKKPIANQAIGVCGGGGYSGNGGSRGPGWDRSNYNTCGGGGGYIGNGGDAGKLGGGGGGGITGDGGHGCNQTDYYRNGGGGGGGLDIGDGYKAGDVGKFGNGAIEYSGAQGGFGYGAGGAGGDDVYGSYYGTRGSNGICIVYWYEVDEYK